MAYKDYKLKEVGSTEIVDPTDKEVIIDLNYLPLNQVIELKNNLVKARNYELAGFIREFERYVDAKQNKITSIPELKNYLEQKIEEKKKLIDELSKKKGNVALDLAITAAVVRTEYQLLLEKIS